jgi:phage-related protein
MDWKPVFFADTAGFEPVKEFILAQSDAAIAEILHVLKLLRQFNITLEMPYSRKITDNIRELRVHHGSDYFRILYSTVPEKQFLLLHGVLKKTDKLSDRDITLAENRLEDFLARRDVAK